MIRDGDPNRGFKYPSVLPYLQAAPTHRGAGSTDRSVPTKFTEDLRFDNRARDPDQSAVDDDLAEQFCPVTSFGDDAILLYAPTC